MRLSDLPIFLIDNTDMSLWLCFKTVIVIDHKKLLMRKSHQLETVVDNISSYVSTA